LVEPDGAPRVRRPGRALEQGHHGHPQGILVSGLDGAGRLGRGQAFAAYLKQRYATEQKVVVVALCGHNARCMFTADPVLPMLFPKP